MPEQLMRIKNRFGRIMDVSKRIGKKMIQKKDAVLVRDNIKAPSKEEIAARNHEIKVDITRMRKTELLQECSKLGFLDIDKALTNAQIIDFIRLKRKELGITK